ncbi:hypothetical protein CHLRE_09g404850v5 [Chlamydomonas reinhardtii]|uniref:Uncharacterized protein n=1 Tax=Chlamydomonas reinhardtii TaxID=3055 RepID=A0A2K3DCJ2_CHLRE|nr:uncharacterized protein CHLRE_09g404850v5 [Chlamydomonas reinhardtii]PNW78256.1 hypothetical protein CHLRE_09g404850v5 [Chlamydomonas reinhardtii]
MQALKVAFDNIPDEVVVKLAKNAELVMSAGTGGRGVGMMARLEQLFATQKEELIGAINKLEAGQQRLEADQQQLKASVQRLQAGQQQMAAQVAASSHNAYARICNSRAGATEPLQPLVREKPPSQASDPAVGSRPPDGDFPATRDDVLDLTRDAFKMLAAFYGQEFGNSNATLAVCRRSFGDFIGVTGL